MLHQENMNITSPEHPTPGMQFIQLTPANCGVGSLIPNCEFATITKDKPAYPSYRSLELEVDSKGAREASIILVKGKQPIQRSYPQIFGIHEHIAVYLFPRERPRDVCLQLKTPQYFELQKMIHNCRLLGERNSRNFARIGSNQSRHDNTYACPQQSSFV